MPEKVQELRKIAKILQNDFAPYEQGCEQYESFIDDHTFITLESWSNQEALDIHLQQDHVRTYVPKMKACIVNGVFDVQFIQGGEISFVTI